MHKPLWFDCLNQLFSAKTLDCGSFIAVFTYLIRNTLTYCEAKGNSPKISPFSGKVAAWGIPDEGISLNWRSRSYKAGLRFAKCVRMAAVGRVKAAAAELIGRTLSLEAVLEEVCSQESFSTY